MTQVNSAQQTSRKVALRKDPDRRNLVQRRADFAGQMRDMALSDLDQIADRLGALHREWNRLDGREWTQQEIALGAGVPYRTYQSWANAENLNTSGEGYVKLARWYSRKLGREITSGWILYGDIQVISQPEASSLKRVEDRIEALREELLAELADARSDLGDRLSRLEPGEKSRAKKRS